MHSGYPTTVLSTHGSEISTSQIGMLEKNNLGTQTTPWWNSAGLTGRNVRSKPWHRVDGPPWITPWIWWFSGRFPMWETTPGRHSIAGAHQLTRMWTNKWRRLDDFGKVFLCIFGGLTHKKELLMEDWPPKIEGLSVFGCCISPGDHGEN